MHQYGEGLRTHPESVDATVNTAETLHGKLDHGIHRSGVCHVN